MAEISRLCWCLYVSPWYPRSLLVTSVHRWGVGGWLGPLGAELVKGFSPPAASCWAGFWVSALEEHNARAGRRGQKGLPVGAGSLSELAGGHRVSSREPSSCLANGTLHPPWAESVAENPWGSRCPHTTPVTTGAKDLAGTPQPSCWPSQETDQRNIRRRACHHPLGLTGVASWGSDSVRLSVTQLPPPRLPALNKPASHAPPVWGSRALSRGCPGHHDAPRGREGCLEQSRNHGEPGAPPCREGS